MGGCVCQRQKKKVSVPKNGPKFPTPLISFIFYRRKIFLMWVGGWVGGWGGESAGAGEGPKQPPPPRVLKQ